MLTWQKKLLGKLAVVFTGAVLPLCLIWLGYCSLHPTLPSEKNAIIFYCNEQAADLYLVLKEALKQAKESIEVTIFSINDSKIIQLLNQKALKGVRVIVNCDYHNLSKVKSQFNAHVELKARPKSGLMHQKIIIIDKKQVWVGSTNLTEDSFRLHSNLLVGVQHLAFAEAISSLLSSPSQALPTFVNVNGQQLEIWVLPHHKKTLDRLLKALEEAQNSIRVAMFTWTHMQLAEAIASAKERGREVSVAVDYYSGQGTSKKVVDYLKEHHVPVTLGEGPGLLHHKLAWIDGDTLIFGSTNWTKAAFKKNDDCLFIIKKLTPKQRKVLQALWKKL